MKRIILPLCIALIIIFNAKTISAQELEIDQKVYQWISQMQLDNGLVEENEGGNMVSLYSNSLAAIVFTYNKDYDKAKKIFQWFWDNYKEFDTAPGGYGQFRNNEGYITRPHRWMGDNCWLLIALKYYQEQSGDDQFYPLAFNINQWIRSLKDKDGGLWGGYDKNGKRIEKNIEGNIDALNAVMGYDYFHEDLFNFLKRKQWDSKNRVFKIDWEPYNHAPDLLSWGYLALGDDYISFLEFSEEFISTKTATNGQEVTGIRFDLVEDDGLWIEVTGQMALAYKVAGWDQKADMFIGEIEKMYAPSAVNPEIGGIIYSTNRGTMFGPGPLWAGADTKPAVGTSCWYLMAKWKIDPMAIGREKLIEGLKNYGVF